MISIASLTAHVANLATKLGGMRLIGDEGEEYALQSKAKKTTEEKAMKNRHRELVQCVPLGPIKSEDELDEAINMVNYLLDQLTDDHGVRMKKTTSMFWGI